MDLLGRKVVMKGGAGLQLLVDAISTTIDRAASVDADKADALRAAVDRLVEVTGQLWSAGDPAVSLANSSIYLEATGHVVIAWMWLEQLIAADGGQGDFYEGKRAAAHYFYRYELPRTGPQFDLLADLDRTTLDADPNWF